MEQAEALQDVAPMEEPSQAPEVDTEVTAEVANDELEGSEEGILDTEAVSYQDVEYEGKSYQVPEELKDAILRQSDYTQKTQEVASQRQALEDQQVQFQQAVQAQQQNMQAYAQLSALQNQLGEYEGVNWEQWSADDAVGAQQAFIKYSQLKDATGNLAQQLQQQEANTLQMQRDMNAKQMEQGRAELERDIAGWNTTMAREIAEYGDESGVSQQELKHITPNQIKILRKAMLYDKSMKNATKKPEAELKPSVKVRGKARAKSDPNKMSTDDWMKWRNKQLMNKG